jgi:hypothetical protein
LLVRPPRNLDRLDLLNAICQAVTGGFLWVIRSISTTAKR